ncbi:MAG TPA: sulfatase [Bryobacteraceae bacterium]|nr:sulfatase [Bryobacteraceae bacterium]
MSLTRRQFVAGGAGAAVSASAVDQKSNVLFIAIDDLNDWIGALGGHPHVKTPNIDRLSRRGVLFTRAYCAAPVCNPSRTTVMTGLRPSTTGVYENRHPWRQAPLLKNAVTLTQHFMNNGYWVAGGGKIFHNSYNDPASWHEWVKESNSRHPDKVPANGIPDKAHFDWGPVDCSDEDMGDWRLAGWAAEQLKRKHDEPFFLAPGFIRPHLPWYVPRKYFDLYDPAKIALPEVKPDDLDDVPPAGRKLATRSGDHKLVLEHKQWRNAVHSYLACISFVDACVGRVIDALDASAYARNTIVVLWSDHGWHLGEKLHWRKFALWEEATRNPLAFVVPELTKAGGRCDRTIDYTSIYPTLLELCSLPAREGLDGVSITRLLKDPNDAWDRPAVTTYERGNHSVRSERWRYIRYRDGSEELYDHSKDELEWTNLANKPELSDVKEQLARWLPATDAPDAPTAR